jgi:hypothetical protein
LQIPKKSSKAMATMHLLVIYYAECGVSQIYSYLDFTIGVIYTFNLTSFMGMLNKHSIQKNKNNKKINKSSAFLKPVSS